MIVAKLSIKYDRGLAHNKEQDLVEASSAPAGFKIAKHGAKTADGKIIRGIGTHYISEEIAKIVQERDRAAREIYNEFRSRFLSTPLDGVYVCAKGAAKKFVESLTIRHDMTVRVTEFNLETPEGLDVVEVGEWAGRIKRQLAAVSLGRAKEADEDGLNALLDLASCPVLSKATGAKIRELVQMVKDNKLSRIEVKRSLETLDVGVEAGMLAPRRSPVIA